MNEKTVKLKVSKDIWKKVSKVAIDLEVTKTQVVNEVLKRYLVNYDKKVKKVSKVKK